MTTEITLPTLEHFTRDELVQLVAILHGALTEAHRDYRILVASTQQALDTLRAVAP